MSITLAAILTPVRDYFSPPAKERPIAEPMQAARETGTLPQSVKERLEIILEAANNNTAGPELLKLKAEYLALLDPCNAAEDRSGQINNLWRRYNYSDLNSPELHNCKDNPYNKPKQAKYEPKQSN